MVEDLLGDKDLTKKDIETIKQTFDEGDNRALFEALDSSFQDEVATPKPDGKPPARKTGATLSLSRLKKPVDAAEKSNTNRQARLKLVEHLLDRHGTGRVLFRNTRAAVKGFPERQVFDYPLPLPDAYADLKTDDAALLLTPEAGLEKGSAWTGFDPRIEWLADRLAELVSEKVLVIAAHAETALDIAQYLKTRTGIHAAVFHEGLSIVERDRAAAYFADRETGTQVLVCSEIGSEGRNFQFAHHMILFDLPLNPDLLEQRIGRLDRIGQTETIRIHVPYLENSAQAVMFNWYHNGLNAFEHTCPIGHAVYKSVEDNLLTALRAPEFDEQGLIDETCSLREEMTEALHRGRDRLLEYNSCRTHIAQELKNKALTEDDEGILADYMDSVFDCFGVDTELHSANCLILNPTEQMVNNFPGLSDEGMTITYSRDTALSFEDAHYITWEHPMTVSTLDMVMSQELGNTSVTAADYAGVQRGTMLVECLYTLEAAPVEGLQTDRYLPPTVIRVLLDEKGVDHHKKLAHEIINARSARVDIETANKIVRVKQPVLKAILERCEKTAEQQVVVLLEQAHQQSSESMQEEVNRLKALSQVNPNVRASEIEFFENQLAALSKILDSASLRLDSLRVMVAT
ncbi:MAG: RNA polymerase-associated protein RapA [Gammaproteobacteria bacterium]|nr:RNA polymerase-associated protein RapA [Gammaproteobacteria bacterium]